MAKGQEEDLDGRKDEEDLCFYYVYDYTVMYFSDAHDKRGKCTGYCY